MIDAQGAKLEHEVMLHPEEKQQEKPFWDTWLFAFMVVPPGFMLAMWAYYEFMHFAVKSWVMYQHYSSMTTVRTDVITIIFAILAIFACKRWIKSAMSQALLSIPMAALWLTALWAALDVIIKLNIIGQFRDAINHAYGVADQGPSILANFMPFWGLPIEAIMVACFAISSVAAMGAVVIMAGYAAFASTKTSDTRMTVEKEQENSRGFYNAGASDYSPLLFVVFLAFAMFAIGYIGVEIYQYNIH